LVVGALLESIVEKGVETRFGGSKRTRRPDPPLRRGLGQGCRPHASGSAVLRRDQRPAGPQVQAVQRAFRLQGLIPTADVLSADVVRVQPLLRETRDLLTNAKDPAR
jgi:hypothetical protein